MTAWIVTGPTAIEEVEAVVQYDGTNAVEVAVLAHNRRKDAPDDYCERLLSANGHRIGQWFAKHKNGDLTVHDTDPRIEPEWEPGGFLDIPKRRRAKFTLPSGWSITGPWVEVTK